MKIDPALTCSRCSLEQQSGTALEQDRLALLTPSNPPSRLEPALSTSELSLDQGQTFWKTSPGGPVSGARTFFGTLCPFRSSSHPALGSPASLGQTASPGARVHIHQPPIKRHPVFVTIVDRS